LLDICHISTRPVFLTAQGWLELRKRRRCLVGLLYKKPPLSLQFNLVRTVLQNAVTLLEHLVSADHLGTLDPQPFLIQLISTVRTLFLQPGLPCLLLGP
jgi:hypothetical protein